MIAMPNEDKALPFSPVPPSYSPYPPPGSTPNGQIYPPPPPMHTGLPPQGYPPPQGSPPVMMSPPVGQGYVTAEAAVGSQYQQQLFARCARGEHDIDKKYGPCGIITAVICFPIGLLALFIDVEKKCIRCGKRFD